MSDVTWHTLRESQFWQHKSLEEMSEPEWEALCDGCGKCCLHKLIDDDTDELYYTDVACKLLDTEAVRCQDYSNRHEQVPGCLAFNAGNVPELYWLPQTCAYRLIHEGRKLEKWHPLISGEPGSVHRFKRSVAGRCVSERDIAIEQLQEHVVRWV